jgi:rsbT co-antagonist protein RsbR
MFRKTAQKFIEENSSSIGDMWLRNIADSSSYNRNLELFIQKIIQEGFLHHLSGFFSQKIQIQQEAATSIEKLFHNYVPLCTEAGVPIGEVIRSFYFIRDVIIKIDGVTEDVDLLLSLIKEVDRFFFEFNGLIHDIYALSWKTKLLAHRSEIMELSAPLIPVLEDIAVMPVVGTIDTDRAQYITENLLYGAIKNESKVVLIDITGVAVVNTMVAQYILKAAEAVHLIGAECIVVGIRPEIAQTMVSLGIELDTLQTLSSLSQGLRQALSMTGKKITDI